MGDDDWGPRFDLDDDLPVRRRILRDWCAGLAFIDGVAIGVAVGFAVGVVVVLVLGPPGP